MIMLNARKIKIRKFFWLILAVVLILQSNSSAQLMKHWGVKAGYTSAHQTLEYVQFTQEVKRRPGINMGAYAEWFNLPVFSVITQVEYDQRGMQIDVVHTENNPTQAQSVTLDNRVDYLSVPVFVKFTLPGAVLSPYVIAGPRFDVLLSSKSDDGFYTAVYDGFKKSSMGASVGAGIVLDFPLLVGFLAEARYNFDLSDAFSNQSLKVRNDSFDLWFGVAF
jgi:hypothetical protein